MILILLGTFWFVYVLCFKTSFVKDEHFSGGGENQGAPRELPFWRFCRRVTVRSDHLWCGANFDLSIFVPGILPAGKKHIPTQDTLFVALFGEDNFLAAWIRDPPSEFWGHEETQWFAGEQVMNMSYPPEV